MAFYGFLLADEWSDDESGTATLPIFSRGAEEENNPKFAPFCFFKYVHSTSIFEKKIIKMEHLRVSRALLVSQL